jgi:hypothetical protein
LMFIVRTIRNTQIHSVGGMQSFSMLKEVVHRVTTGLKELVMCWIGYFIILKRCVNCCDN